MAYERSNVYDAEPIVCHATAARMKAARAYQQTKGDPDGVLWRITDREVDG